MQLLKVSTAVTLKIGPFLDPTTGDDAETGLTIAQADIRLSKNGGNIAQKNEATTCTRDELGVYGCPINATDTATLGRLQLWVHEAGALPVWHEYLVVTANVYDTLFSTDVLQSDLTQIGGDTQSATDLKDFADAGYDPATNKVQGVVLTDTCTTNTDLVSAAAVVNEWETQSQADPTGFHVNVLEIGGTAQTANDNGADINAILVDTAVIGAAGAGLTALPWNAAWDAEVQSECTDALVAYDPPTKGEMDTAHALLATPAQVNTEVVDVLKTDTISEPAQGAPPATPTFEEALVYLYLKLRNKTETTATEDALYDNAGTTKLIKSALSDDATTFTKAEYGTGA